MFLHFRPLGLYRGSRYPNVLQILAEGDSWRRVWGGFDIWRTFALLAVLCFQMGLYRYE